MSRLIKIFLVFLLVLGLGVPALAGPPGSPAPRWTPVPQAPGVEYAPNLATDLFRYAGRFFFYSQGRWQQGPSINGPWIGVPRLPAPLYQIQAPYFKNPPGWAKGKKTGWKGAPMPPGQMKKFDQGGSLPPGQMKKLERGGSLPPGQMKKFQ
jgi:hypothetical protein